MKTLFLNPNSSERVTAVLGDAIRAAGGTPSPWEVRLLPGAPDVISSEADNLIAEAAVAAQLPALAERFERIVLMSSLDTGYATARKMFGNRVHGFTRSVLARQRQLGARVQAITFGEEMAPLYDAIFAEGDTHGVVQSHTVCPSNPLALAHADTDRSAAQLAATCDELHAASSTPVFVVGAVVLPTAAQLREQGRPWIVDPVADLLAFLSTQPDRSS